ncbi:MAG: molybdopterin cofactor-binding domain-containing protein [Bacteroidota bacterium]
MSKKISRRKFLVRGSLGTLGVLAVGTYLFRNPLRRTLIETIDATLPSYSGTGTEATLWFELTKENKVIFHSPKVEMGQGSFTSFAQMIAEELDVSLDQIVIQAAATETGIVDGLSTGGSLSIATFWKPLRELAATMREMLKMLAAQKLGVAANSLSTKDGIISGGGKTLTYAAVAEGVTEWPELDEVPEPRSSGFKHIGKPVQRVDLGPKVFGEPIFGMDAEIPGMLHAAIIRPSAIGAKLKSVDTETASKMPGVVQVVKMEEWVGIVAQSYPQALAAKMKMKVEWDIPKVWTNEDLQEILQVGKGDRLASQKEGDALDPASEDVMTMEFRSPIGAHAQLEPNAAVADYKDGKVTVILSTQVIGITQKMVADAMDLELENVNIVPTYLGGGFGRRLNTSHAIQACELSKAVGKPVKYVFTRKEEFQNDQFRPPTHHIMHGRLGEDGYLDSLEHHYASGDVSFNSVLLPNFLNNALGTDLGAIRGANIMYHKIPNYHTVQWHLTLPFATSWWRSLGLLANTFAVESFVDEMALKAKKDPVDFRLKRLDDSPNAKRIRKVIETAVEKSGYVDEVVDGRAMGLAASIDTGTPAAHVAEVSIKDGNIIVHKVTCAVDCGLAVNPDQVRAQCEGAIIMGMSGALYEKMELKDGALTPTIYGPYKMALMRHAPKEIDIHLVQGLDIPMPVGEPPMGPIGAAIGNAVRRLTGKRLTELPINLEKLEA